MKDHTNYDVEYWLSKTPEERIEAVEFLRKLYLYESENDSAPRLQRIIRNIDIADTYDILTKRDKK